MAELPHKGVPYKAGSKHMTNNSEMGEGHRTTPKRLKTENRLFKPDIKPKAQALRRCRQEGKVLVGAGVGS